MDNPEKLAPLGTQDTVRRQTKQNKNRTTMRKKKQLFKQDMSPPTNNWRLLINEHFERFIYIFLLHVAHL